MTNEMLYKIIGDMKEEHILEAKQVPKRTPYHWLKWSVLAACLCLILGISLQFASWNTSNGSGFFGDDDTTLLEVHRDDFSPEIDASILVQLENPNEVKKAYWLLSNQWFLSDKLIDFSQVVTTDVYYISWCDENGVSSDAAYSFYEVNESGNVVWDTTVYPPTDAFTPFEFWKLSYEVIDNALYDITYEDYIITYSPRLGTVFVWVRGTTEDFILTYPSRPDLLGIECGEIYTLEELQEILTETYKQD